MIILLKMELHHQFIGTTTKINHLIIDIADVVNLMFQSGINLVQVVRIGNE